MNTNRNTTLFRAIAAIALLAPTLAQAHPGHPGHEGDIGWGLLHPLTGIDHLLAAFAVGMLAVLSKRVSLAVVFLVAGVVGGFVGAVSGAFSGLESALALSVIALGAAVVFHRHLARVFAFTVVALVALAHGWAHGSEAAGVMSVAGIFLTTAALVGFGGAVTWSLRNSPATIKFIGAGSATAAVAILAGVI